MKIKAQYIYRVQDKDGKGPYQFNVTSKFKDFYKFTKITKIRPIHYYYSNIDYRHGFVSIAKMKRWFSKQARQMMKDSGIKLCKFELIDNDAILYKDYAQVIFDPNKVKLVEQKELEIN